MSDLPKLDWRPRKDPQSLNYPIRTALPRSIRRKNRYWTPGIITDQGAEGACVGHAWCSEATAKPIPVDLNRLKAHTPDGANEFARFLYGMARYLDPWPGESYEGTSVLAGAKAAQNVNTLQEYRWAFGGAPEVADSILSKGPVVIGIPWHESMYEAPAGVLRVGGQVVGGHALTAIGVNSNSERLPGKTTIYLQNSWGKDWGINGVAEISIEDLGALLRQDGEACVPTRRSYGR